MISRPRKSFLGPRKGKNNCPSKIRPRKSFLGPRKGKNSSRPSKMISRPRKSLLGLRKGKNSSRPSKMISRPRNHFWTPQKGKRSIHPITVSVLQKSLFTLKRKSSSLPLKMIGFFPPSARCRQGSPHVRGQSFGGEEHADIFRT